MGSAIEPARPFRAASAMLLLGAVCVSCAAADDLARADARFAALDQNLDQRLSGTEFRACNCGMLDTDADGEISRAEFMVGLGSAEYPSDLPVP